MLAIIYELSQCWQETEAVHPPDFDSESVNWGRKHAAAYCFHTRRIHYKVSWDCYSNVDS